MAHVNESDPKLMDPRLVLAEVQRLREENIRLRPPWAAGGILLNSMAGSSFACRVRQPHINERTAIAAIFMRLEPFAAHFDRNPAPGR